MRLPLFAIFMGLAGQAYAEENLGIQYGQLSFGIEQDESGKSQLNDLGAIVDVAITHALGLQGNVSFSDSQMGGIGSIGAHLYMNPTGAHKYGLFGTVRDTDGEDITWGSFGAEYMFNLNARTTLEFQMGLGLATQNLDYVFGSAGLSYELNDSMIIAASFDVADFDELTFRATSHETTLSIEYQPQNSRFSGYASVSHSGLVGKNGASPELRLGAGLRMNFGRRIQSNAKSRPFREAGYVDQLVRRQMFFEP